MSGPRHICEHGRWARNPVETGCPTSQSSACTLGGTFSTQIPPPIQTSKGKLKCRKSHDFREQNPLRPRQDQIVSQSLGKNTWLVGVPFPKGGRPFSSKTCNRLCRGPEEQSSLDDFSECFSIFRQKNGCFPFHSQLQKYAANGQQSKMEFQRCLVTLGPPDLRG